jgi:hypothetical protein
VIYKSKVAEFAYADGLVEDVRLADVEFLRRVEVEFNGVLTATGGAADATLLEDGLLNTVLKAMKLTADGSDPFINTNGRNEYWRRAVVTGSTGVLASVIPTGIASTNQRLHAVIDMDGVATAARFAGRINSRRLADLTLRVTAGAVETDLVTGGDRVETMTGTVEIYAVWDDGGRGAGSPDALGFRGGGRRIAEQRYPVTAANLRAMLDIPNGLLIPRILFLVIDNSLRDSDLLENVQIKIGEKEILRDVSFKEMTSANVERYGLALSSGLPPYAGIAIMDFDLDGDMHPAKILSTVGLKSNSAKAILEVNSPTSTAYVDMIVYAVDPNGVGKGGRVR